jgi:hypothetical protein
MDFLNLILRDTGYFTSLSSASESIKSDMVLSKNKYKNEKKKPG